MGFSEEALLQFFAQYAYQPMWVYSAIIALMVASSFGLPAPEEITLFATGLVCYIGSRPDLFPPPYEGAPVVNVYVAATICLLSVFLSDFLVYTLGRYFGGRLLRTRWLHKYTEQLEKVQLWTRRYGMWAAGIFRFTPGLRFPGHFACGMMGLKISRFFAVDGTAALLTVPTQVLLVAYFGESILENIREVKIVLFSLIAIGVTTFVTRKYLAYKRRHRKGSHLA